MNLFDKLKVEQFTLYNSPVGDGGAALVFRFENPVEIDGDDTMAFPLDNDQMLRLFRLVVGWASERQLIAMREAERLVKLPHELP